LPNVPRMKIVIPGGSGQIGQMLARGFVTAGHEVVILSRAAAKVGRTVSWDGRTVGAWAKEIDGADVVLNLAGRTVNCRYTEENLRAMMDSRVESTRAVGEAIAAAASAPRLWLQMSTATIYAHRLDAPNDEATGIIGGNEAGVPAYWATSVKIATEWERALNEAKTPKTRRVALRSAMMMSPDREGIFDVMLGMVRKGLGGTAAGGAQFVSWMHDVDFSRAIDLLIARDDLEGPFNLAAPNPLPYADFMRAMREAWGTRVGLPATKWMLEIGAWAMRTDTELVLKSRRVIPGRLLEAGFQFEQPSWPAAAKDLTARWRAQQG
jgi:uncharacterized protein (TIGR01777 family)